MIRPFPRRGVERYGHYSLAAESMYDHPFQWGSKRTGPDLARVGGRYSSEWHVQHLTDPRSVVPESNMPAYGFLARTQLRVDDADGHLRANRAVGVPYDDENDRQRHARFFWRRPIPIADPSGLEARYPNVRVEAFDGDPFGA